MEETVDISELVTNLTPDQTKECLKECLEQTPQEDVLDIVFKWAEEKELDLAKEWNES